MGTRGEAYDASYLALYLGNEASLQPLSEVESGCKRKRTKKESASVKVEAGYITVDQ